MSTDSEMMKTVTFTANGCECVAYVAFGKQYGVNFHSCMLHLGEHKPAVHIEYVPHAARVKINDAVWFDCHPDEAAEIEALFA